MVVPHKEAVFSTSTTLPLYLSILTTSPARVRADSAWNPAIYSFIWVCLEHLKNDYIAVRLKSKTAKEMIFEQNDKKYGSV